MDPLDIWRAAKLFIDRHGGGASLQAALGCERLAEAGDKPGAAVWREILGALDELQRNDQAHRRAPALKGELTNAGVRLLDRTTRWMTSTSEGEDNHRRCLVILSAMEEADAAAAQTVQIGPLRINIHSRSGGY